MWLKAEEKEGERIILVDLTKARVVHLDDNRATVYFGPDDKVVLTDWRIAFDLLPYIVNARREE